MSEPTKAVFLSYASQDADAAKRICDALRQAGVEVWFDSDGGLEHGDEWDAKIRRQIKECVLFLPLISANTQAREEGYFRLEWDLAAERARTIASGVAFILPVIVDGTKEPDALVPDRFRSVQWTRLPGGAVPPDVLQRFLKLWSHRTGALKHKAMEPGHPRPGERGEGAAAPIQDRSNRRLGWIAALALAGIAAWWGLRPLPAPLPVASGGSVAPSSPQARDWPKNPELKRVIELIEGLDSIPDDFALAEQIVKPIVERAPADAEAVTVMARVQSHYLKRGFDRTDERAASARRYAERALQLAPDEPEAIYALACYLDSRGTDGPRAERLLRRAMELDPANPRPGRELADMLFGYDRRAEALAQGQDNVRRFPTDVLSRYDLARLYKDQGRYEEFGRELEATLAIAPLPNAIVWKARLQFGLHNDFAGMKTWLDRVPERVRGTERAVFGYFLYAAFGGQTEAGLAALRGFPQKWFTDFEYAGPTALLNASLLELQGRTELARQQYEAALTEIQKMRATDPGRANLSNVEFWTLLGLGRKEESRASYRRMIEGARRPYAQSLFTGWWFTAIPAALLLDERATALVLLRESVATVPESRAAYRLRFQIDPRMAPWRDDPEIKSLLTETPTGAAAATPPTAAPSPARELAGKALALLQGLEATREDFALAEDYCQRALKLDSTDGEVWAVYAQLHSAFGYRGWDTSPERREQNRVMAERAIRLAPTSVQARLAQAGAWTAFGINRAESEKLLRDVVQEQPANQGALRFLAVTVLNRGGLEECLALNERSAALPGGDPLALFNNARYLWQRGRQAEAYVIMQRSLAQKPFSSSLILKMSMELTWRDDLVAAEATLQQIPQSALLEDRANYTAGLLRFYQRRADAALEAWGAFPRDYYSDFQYDGPKGLLIGLAHEMDHRDAAAKIEWRTALQLVEKRIAATPNKPAPYYYQAYLLACLGEKAAAGEALRTYEQLFGIKYTPGSEITFELALVYARLGRFDDIFAQSPDRFFRRIRIDPRFDGMRSDPRYAKLLAEFERQKAEPKK